jgi:sphinganine-1-phosphate aldolase
MPPAGRSGVEISELLDEVSSADLRWRDGRHQGWVYWPGDKAAAIAQEASRRFYYANPLLSRAFPSMSVFEGALLDTAARLLHAPEVHGIVTTGGTESNLLAVWSALQAARRRGRSPSRAAVVVPFSAHPTFNKAGDYFGLDIVRVPTTDQYVADPIAMERAIDANTVLLVGSAPSYPHGSLDPIRHLGEVAEAHGIPLHVDACLGGMILPFIERLGRPIEAWDFRIRGVTSMSADMHKHGYSPKGVSVLLMRDEELKAGTSFEFFDWPNGRYRTSTLTGSRSGSSIAGAWAVLQILGESGFLSLTAEVMQIAEALQRGIESIPTLSILGHPPANKFAYLSRNADVVAVGDGLEARAWTVMRLAIPEAIGMQVATYHRPVVDDYLTDLRLAVDDVIEGRVSRSSARASYN